jgi:5'-nucleotidase
MSEKPLILVTNDDGITAPGIRALVQAAKQVGHVVVFSPDSPQSGMGHAITVNNPLRVNESREHEGVEAWTCDGTPVDCVKLAIYEKLRRKPDLLVSGINHGSNASTNVLYSGTMSAAVEGAMEGVPSIGFSLADHAYNADFTAATAYAVRIMAAALANGIPTGMCLNVNVPKLPLDQIKGVKICRQAHAYWEDTFDKRLDPLGKEYFWLTGEFRDHDHGSDTDIFALKNGYISVVPTQFDMTAHHAISTINAWGI